MIDIKVPNGQADAWSIVSFPKDYAWVIESCGALTILNGMISVKTYCHGRWLEIERRKGS